MNKSQAKEITHQIATHFTSIEKLGKYTEEVWIENLKRLNYPQARDAAKNVIHNMPKSYIFGMLDWGVFRDHYTDIAIPEQPKYCPCCAGSGWVTFPTTGQPIAYRCSCWGEKHRKTLENNERSICENTLCQNPHHLEHLEFQAGHFNKFPAEHRAWKSGACKYCRTITEKRIIHHQQPNTGG
jgi:hypothetical protein